MQAVENYDYTSTAKSVVEQACQYAKLSSTHIDNISRIVGEMLVNKLLKSEISDKE